MQRTRSPCSALMRRADAARQRDSVPAAQRDVEHGDVECGLGDGAQRLLAGVAFDDFANLGVPVALDQRAHTGAEERVIVHRQHAQRGTSRGRGGDGVHARSCAAQDTRARTALPWPSCDSMTSVPPRSSMRITSTLGLW